jgi:hypothetical protein
MNNGLIVEELWSKASPKQFEKLLGRLLGEMGFSDVKVTGKSGDGGVDLRAIWTQREVPGLEIDLQFFIQAKRTKPSVPLNPRYLRELKGILKSGEWGLLITTGKVTETTRQSGIEDPSRVVSVIDGKKLAELCKQYKVGVREHFDVDLSSLEEELAPSPPEQPGEETATDVVLSRALGESFERIGNSPIFKSQTRILLARYSQYYREKSSNYWYGVTPKDLERVKEYHVNAFAFVCDEKGVVLLDVDELKSRIEGGFLWRSPAEGTDLRHFHILLRVMDGKMVWQLKGSNVDVTSRYYPMK